MAYFLLHYPRYDNTDELIGVYPIIVNTNEVSTVERGEEPGKQAIVTMANGRRFNIIEDFEHLLSILDVPHI